MKYDVCVFGGCSLDRMFYQNIDGTYSHTPNLITYGGKGSNQAVSASRAGASVVMLTRIGKDGIGKNIIDNLLYNGVNTSHVEIVDGLKNDYSNIYINLKDKDNFIERFGNAIDSFSPEMIDKYSDVLLSSNIVVCQLKCPIETTERLINFCYDNNKMVILTPCRPKKLIGRKDLIDKVTLVTCNRKESEIIFETNDIESACKQYPNKLIVTLGSEGLMYHNGKRIVKMPAIDVNVVDTTGAGDTLAGNLASQLSKGIDLQHALRKSMYASAMKIKVKSAQDGMPYLDELENFMSLVRNKKFIYNNELNYAIEIIKKAYQNSKSTKNFIIQQKDDNTLVTNVDLDIENYLIKKIREKFPNDNFLTEENYSKNELEPRTWVIDPIDGTNHFIKKTPFWGIQMAFYDAGTTKFSVIYLPILNELYYAAENNGAYINNNRILPSFKNPLSQCVIEFGGSLQKEINTKKEYLYKLIDGEKLKIANIIYINTCCISFTNLATAKTDALIISTKKPWDIMPGSLICKESGIKSYFMDFDGKLTLLTSNENVSDLLLEPSK